MLLTWEREEKRSRYEKKNKLILETNLKLNRLNEDFHEMSFISAIMASLHSFFYKNDFIRTKALILAKKKNKLRIKLGLLPHRT